MPAIINSDDGVVSGSAGLKTSGANDGILALQNNGTTNVTVTAAGNVGIGTASPARKLDVRGGIGMQVNEDGAGTKVISMRSDFAGVGPAINVTTNDPLLFLTNNTEQARITAAGLFQFNSGYGSVATAYGCRAWVNFNGTGTVAIRASGNVSSITDVGTGQYTVNFTTAMSDVNYSAPCSCNQRQIVVAVGSSSSLDIVTRDNTGTLIDTSQIFVAIFR
jgi:hypothetical protein